MKINLTDDEMIELFDLTGISKSPSIFDEVKLKWLNGEYLKAMSDEDFIVKAKPFFDKTKLAGKCDINKVAKLIKSRIEILSDIEEKTAFLVEVKPFDNALYENKKQKTVLQKRNNLKISKCGQDYSVNRDLYFCNALLKRSTASSMEQ